MKIDCFRVGFHASSFCFVALILSFIIGGCLNLNDYYREYDSIAETIATPPGEEIVFREVELPELEKTLWSYRDRDYSIAGKLSLVSSKIGNGDFLDFAKEKGAKVVILTKRFFDKITSYTPVQTPAYETYVHYRNGRAYPRTYYTSYTSYLPFEEDRYEYDCYLLRQNKVVSQYGLFLAELEGEALQRAGTHKGVEVIHVSRGKKAWQHDIFAGDIILKLDGKGIESSQNLLDSLENSKIKHKLEILRKDNKLEIEL